MRATATSSARRCFPATSDDPAVRALADGELAPLLQNKELLNAYMGLMIGG